MGGKPLLIFHSATACDKTRGHSGKGTEIDTRAHLIQSAEWVYSLIITIMHKEIIAPVITWFRRVFIFILRGI